MWGDVTREGRRSRERESKAETERRQEEQEAFASASLSGEKKIKGFSKGIKLKEEK